MKLTILRNETYSLFFLTKKLCIFIETKSYFRKTEDEFLSYCNYCYMWLTSRRQIFSVKNLTEFGHCFVAII